MARTAAADQVFEEKMVWLREVISPQIDSLWMDEHRNIPADLVIELGNQGLLGFFIAKEFGGLGWSYGQAFKFVENLAALDTTLAIFVGLNNVLGIKPLNFAKSALKQKALPSLAKGHELGAFAFTEPGAGSNPKKMESSATPVSDHAWKINGVKIWIGSAAWATYIHVFVNLLDAQGKNLGLTAFTLQRNTPGLTIGEEALTLGVKGMVQNRIYLQDVLVTRENMLGRPGEGLTVSQDTMKIGRVGLCTIALGAMKKCYCLAYLYAKKREIGTGLLLDSAFAGQVLLEITYRCEIIEEFLKYVAKALDEKKELPEEFFLAAKILGPEFLGETADAAMQLLGGRGYIETLQIAKIYRDARLLRIFEGPTETLSHYLGMLLSKKKSAFITEFLERQGEGAELRNLQMQLVSNSSMRAKNGVLFGKLGAFIIAKALLKNSSHAELLKWMDRQIEKLAKEMQAPQGKDRENILTQFYEKTKQEIGSFLKAKDG